MKKKTLANQLRKRLLNSGYISKEVIDLKSDNDIIISYVRDSQSDTFDHITVDSLKEIIQGCESAQDFLEEISLLQGRERCKLGGQSIIIHTKACSMCPFCYKDVDEVFCAITDSEVRVDVQMSGADCPLRNGGSVTVMYGDVEDNRIEPLLSDYEEDDLPNYVMPDKSKLN